MPKSKNFSFVVIAKLFPQTLETVKAVFASMFRSIENPISQRAEYDYVEKIATFSLESDTLIDQKLILEFVSLVNSNLLGEKMYFFSNIIPELSVTTPVSFFVIVFKKPVKKSLLVNDLYDFLSLETFGCEDCGFTVGSFDKNCLFVVAYSLSNTLDDLESKVIEKIYPNRITVRFKL